MGQRLSALIQLARCGSYRVHALSPASPLPERCVIEDIVKTGSGTCPSCVFLDLLPGVRVDDGWVCSLHPVLGQSPIVDDKRLTHAQ